MLLRNLRICIIGNQAFSLLNFRGPLIAEMVKGDCDVFALAPDYDEDTRSSIQKLGAQPVSYLLSRTGMNPLKDVADMLNLATILKRLKPDMTLGYSVKPVIYGTIAAWLARVPQRFAMIEGLGYVFTPSYAKMSLRRKMLRLCVSAIYMVAIQRANLVFFLNCDDIEYFTSRHLITPKKAFLIGGIGIDLKEWPATVPIKEPVTFLLAARLLREKGIIEYADAARIIKQIYPFSRFILLGGLDSNPGALSQNEVQRWSSEGILEWPGHVSDVSHWLAQTSVYVLPSYREGVPRSTQEAMAMARPVITTDVPGCRETVIDGKNGFIVPVRDANALSAAMEKFILNPDMIERMGLVSRHIAEERFDVHKINQVIMQKMGLIKKIQPH